jgi:MFS family permease
MVGRQPYFYTMLQQKSNGSLLILLIFSQFAGTSLWFAGNAVIDSLPGISPNNYAGLTSVVQAGFITGTLLFSLFSIADRFSSTRVFFISSVVASLSNLFIIYSGDVFFLFSMRFITGFFLAGIYPVGMKIVADLFPDKIGKALGLLVGALVFGTAFPHLVRSQTADINWKVVLISSSILAFVGGVIVLVFIPSKQKAKHVRSFQLLDAFQSFRLKDFRSAAFGYFGHMWELYAFWAILPILFSYYAKYNNAEVNIYLWSFAVIASGSLGCIAGGFISQKWGSKKVAFYSLFFSGICCLVSPFFFQSSFLIFSCLLLIWGFTVTADSPQFSALVAKAVEDKNKGTALTIVTSIGFSITIISIQLLKEIFDRCGPNGLWILCLGPLAGLLSLKPPR